MTKKGVGGEEWKSRRQVAHWRKSKAGREAAGWVNVDLVSSPIGPLDGAFIVQVAS